MSSSTSSTIGTNKLPAPSNNSNWSQTPSSAGAEAFSRRSNSSGPGTTARQIPQPRNNQPLRKQHKVQRRARLVDEDAMAEATAMKSINSRKGQTSITHLMNFALPPRPHYQHQNHHLHGRYVRRNPTWGLGSGYHAVDKARYIHANYRFIVRPDKDYNVQAIDADVHVNWDNVLQILASAETQSAHCPICLSIPVAPRMAKCGHIFCLPCLIRYMHSTDDTNPAPEKRARWKKCPICEDSIYLSETRPVRWFVGQDSSMLQEGGDVLLRLLKREPGMTLALPRDAGENYGSHNDIPWYYVAEVMEYARFMKGGEDYMIAEYDREVSELEIQEKEDELMFGDDTTWTRKALNAIEDAKQKLHGIGNPEMDDGKTESDHHDKVPDSWEDDGDPAGAKSSNSSSLDKDHHESASKPSEAADKIPNPKPGTRHARQTAHSFYFYHALPNFFLSPLDIRILKTAFGEFSSFPSTVLPRVEHISTGHIIDDDLRKRAKYMAHLPYGCEVSFLECDWTDVINPPILEQFAEDISKRRKRNHEKEAREERDRVRAEKEEEDKRWAAARRRRPSSGRRSFSDAEFHPLVHLDAPAESSPPTSSLAMTPPWGNGRSLSSFATLASPGTSPDASRTVWGTTAVAASTPPLIAVTEPIQQDDGWLQGWEKDLLDETDAIASVEASINGESSSKASSGHGTGKKAKKKKITLMSTNNRRGA